MTNRTPIVEIQNISVRINGKDLLKDVNLEIYPNEILGIIGRSGGGKSVLLQTILNIIKPTSGNILFDGQSLQNISYEKSKSLKSQMGVLFQNGALFSSLTVLENVKLPMIKYINLPDNLLTDYAKLKISLVGLQPDVYNKMPSEISGGMIKKVKDVLFTWTTHSFINSFTNN